MRYEDQAKELAEFYISEGRVDTNHSQDFAIDGVYLED